MSISANALKKHLVRLNEEAKGRHVSRFLCYGHDAFFAYLSGNEPRRLSIVLSDREPRIYLGEGSYDVPSLESQFADLLRKELSNAYLAAIEEEGDDRVALLSFTIINSVYKEEGRSLYFEMIPHHANLILVDEEGKVVSAFRPGSMEDERPLLRGMAYELPRKKDFAIQADEPFDEAAYVNSCLDKEKELAETRKKDRFGAFIEAEKRRAKLLERKIKAIEGDIRSSREHFNDGEIGDYIFMNKSSLIERSPSIAIEGKTIPLDPSKTLSTNAQTFYRRAKKAKATAALGEENLVKAKKELSALLSTLALIKEADESGLEELFKEELKQSKTPSKNGKAPQKGLALAGSTIPYEVLFGTTRILFGKSAKENDCLTFLLDTSKNHAWLHVLGTTGSHLMIKKDAPTKDEIRMGAELCLLNSRMASGEVMVALRKDVRKGAVPGQAIVKKFETVHVSHVSEQAEKLFETARKMELK